MSNVEFSFSGAGRAFAVNAAERAAMLKALGDALQGATLAQWSEARKQFVEGAKAAGYSAPEKLWERTIEAGQDAGHVPDKPVSETPAAAKKAEQREAKKAAEKADTRTVVELKAEAAKLAEAGKLIDAGKLAALAEKKAAADVAAAKKAAAEKVKPDVEAIRAALETMKKAADSQGLAALAYVAGLLANGQHGHVMPAVEALRATMKAEAAKKGKKGKKTEPAPM